MIKLFSVKDKAKKAPEDGTEGAKPNKLSAGELRLQKDLVELSLPHNISINFPETREKLMHFEILLKSEEGVYKGGKFLFDFTIPTGYPHDPPKVLCKTKVFHPNIDLEGKICLNILREDWKPVLSISSVIYGLQFLFMDPNPEDPLNKEAAVMFRDNPRQFESYVQKSINSGAYINNQYFPPCTH
ncbi:ubiquitin-conjugating enzyme/RWD-like protein [Haematococcus lacustris]